MSKNKSHLAILSIGTNLGDKHQNIIACKQLLETFGQIEKCSSVFESEGWGDNDLLPFYNVCIGLRTDLNLMQLFEKLKIVEIELGRKNKSVANKYENRIIDIDIIYFDDEVYESEKLTIPHVQMQKRLFVLAPLMEIFPKLKHPTLGKNTKELLDSCNDQTAIKSL